MRTRTVKMGGVSAAAVLLLLILAFFMHELIPVFLGDPHSPNPFEKKKAPKHPPVKMPAKPPAKPAHH